MQCVFDFHIDIEYDLKAKELIPVSFIKPRVPTIEDILETIIFKEPPIDICQRKMESEVLVISDEIIPNLSGQISYVSFT